MNWILAAIAATLITNAVFGWHPQPQGRSLCERYIWARVISWGLVGLLVYIAAQIAGVL